MIIVSRIEGQPSNTWAIASADDGTIHVVPWDDRIDGFHAAHRVEVTCPCQPTPKRDAPLDDAVWNHHEPTWPGSADYPQ